jgi:hypothetical protein
MSGQPNINPTDPSKFRQQYLSNLALRASLDDMNLQANKIYAKTQQTPSQLTDTRTITEKYADVEGLKRDLRSELSSITEGPYANDIVNSLDPTELEFLATYIAQIKEDIKLKFKYGVLPAVFIPYLQRYMDREVRTRGVNEGLQQSSGRDILLGIRQILGGMVTTADLLTLEQRLETSAQRQTDRATLIGIQREIGVLRATIPDATTLAQLNQISNANLKFQIQEDLNTALQFLPTHTQLATFITQLDIARRAGDDQRTSEVLREIRDVLAVEPSTVDAIRDVERNILEQIGKVRVENPGKRAGESYISPAIMGGQTFAKLKDYVSFLYDNVPGVFGRVQKNALVNSNKETLTSALLDADPTIRDYFGLSGESRGQAYSRVGLTQSQLGDFTGINPMLARGAVSPASSVGATTTGTTLTSAGSAPTLTPKKPGGGRGLSGRRSFKGRGVMAEHTDFSVGLTPANRFVPFGKYFIHNHKLNENVVSLRNPSGCNIVSLPSTRITAPLGNVLRKIVGGGQPNFDELNKLDDEDRRYLHTIAKKSNLLDKISVPTPSKDLEAEEINKFEIMRGEIMSGNDNRDFIKEFKLLLVKLTNKGLLPSRQSKELLLDLATMGY